ncbi:NagB/RpiA/CoA transferase-like superfamily protein [Actinidia rufa]|uniref:Translation initiation factor eIF2B subunit delta n=1 Tax=Actinidia rufa TaxID=165716 RepID=A0A7J0GN32_9ERIC|nr:NagB/RpiA/CoA transferase-like superfamily protein [Actinidia rufa]
MDPPRRTSRVIDPKVRHVGFFAPLSPGRTQSGPPAPAAPSPVSGSPSGNSLSPVMIPPPRHASDNLSSALALHQPPSRPVSVPVTSAVRRPSIDNVAVVGSYNQSETVLATSPSAISPSGRIGDGEFSEDSLNWIRRTNSGKFSSSVPTGGFDLAVKNAQEVFEKGGGKGPVISNELASNAKPLKDKMTKAERRAMQESQRAAKAAAKGSSAAKEKRGWSGSSTGVVFGIRDVGGRWEEAGWLGVSDPGVTGKEAFGIVRITWGWNSFHASWSSQQHGAGRICPEEGKEEMELKRDGEVRQKNGWVTHQGYKFLHCGKEESGEGALVLCLQDMVACEEFLFHEDFGQRAITSEIILGEDLVEAKEEEWSLWMEENISGVCNVLKVNIGVVKKKVLVEAKEEEWSLWMEENISGVCNVLKANIGVVKKKACLCQPPNNFTDLYQSLSGFVQCYLERGSLQYGNMVRERSTSYPAEREGRKPAAASGVAPFQEQTAKGVKQPSQKKDIPPVAPSIAASEKKGGDRPPEKDRKKDVPPPRMQFDDKNRVEKAKRRAVVKQTEARNRVELFRHLPQYEHGTRLPDLEAKFFQLDPMHPAVYKVGLQYLAGDVFGAYKFHERVQLDSICSNELGDPDVISKVPGRMDVNYLDNWANKDNLQLLNLLYDATPSDYISMIITDYGMVPPTSVPVIVREYGKELLLI